MPVLAAALYRSRAVPSGAVPGGRTALFRVHSPASERLFSNPIRARPLARGARPGRLPLLSRQEVISAGCPSGSPTTWHDRWSHAGNAERAHLGSLRPGRIESSRTESAGRMWLVPVARWSRGSRAPGQQACVLRPPHHPREHGRVHAFLMGQPGQAHGSVAVRGREHGGLGQGQLGTDPGRRRSAGRAVRPPCAAARPSPSWPAPRRHRGGPSGTTGHRGRGSTGGQRPASPGASARPGQEPAPRPRRRPAPRPRRGPRPGQRHLSRAEPLVRTHSLDSKDITGGRPGGSAPGCDLVLRGHGRSG